MKFLVDAQLPVKLCEILEKLGLESIHVDSLPKGDETQDMNKNYKGQSVALLADQMYNSFTPACGTQAETNRVCVPQTLEQE